MKTFDELAAFFKDVLRVRPMVSPQEIDEALDRLADACGYSDLGEKLKEVLVHYTPELRAMLEEWAVKELEAQARRYGDRIKGQLTSLAKAGLD